MTSLSYKLSGNSYLLLLLHAQKYIHSIAGLLLGTTSEAFVQITHVLPLAHSDLTIHTTPLLETGLHLSEHYAESQGVSIVGIYYSNDVIEDTTLPTHVARIAGRVRERFAEACILRIDGAKLQPAVRRKEHCLVLHRGEGWRKGSTEGLVGETALGRVERALGVPGVCDLEDHLLDPRADWLNSDVLRALDAL